MVVIKADVAGRILNQNTCERAMPMVKARSVVPIREQRSLVGLTSRDLSASRAMVSISTVEEGKWTLCKTSFGK